MKRAMPIWRRSGAAVLALFIVGTANFLFSAWADDTGSIPVQPANQLMSAGMITMQLSSDRRSVENSNSGGVQAKGKEGDVTTQILPAYALIRGVPFVSWNAAAHMNYKQKDIINPSVVASEDMMMLFWRGDDLEQFRRQSESNADWVVVYKHDATDFDIKKLVARGVPVEVDPGLTPYGHPLYPVVEMYIQLKGPVSGVSLSSEGRPRSHMLPRILTYDELAKTAEATKMNSVEESVMEAARLVIGYDDKRKVFILHDPTFGPAFELPYADFDRMWKAGRNVLWTKYPRVPSVTGEQSQNGPEYRAANANERAAKHYLYGLTLNATGNLVEGEKELLNGLRENDVEKGYRHLMEFELALNYGERASFQQATAEAEKAADLVPEDPGPWAFLSELYTIAGDTTRAGEAKERAQHASEDVDGLRRLAVILPSDFWLSELAPLRGWSAP